MTWLSLCTSPPRPRQKLQLSLFVVLAVLAAIIAVDHRALGASPDDLSNFQGNYACPEGVRIGRALDVDGVAGVYCVSSTIRQPFVRWDTWSHTDTPMAWTDRMLYTLCVRVSVYLRAWLNVLRTYLNNNHVAAIVRENDRVKVRCAEQVDISLTPAR